MSISFSSDTATGAFAFAGLGVAFLFDFALLFFTANTVGFVVGIDFATAFSVLSINYNCLLSLLILVLFSANYICFAILSFCLTVSAVVSFFCFVLSTIAPVFTLINIAVDDDYYYCGCHYVTYDKDGYCGDADITVDDTERN